MLHTLIAGLFLAVSHAGAHERGDARRENGGQAKLVQHSPIVETCYTDADCGNNQYCNNGECDDEVTICYGDDECRGRMVCDMGSYICVEPTPSPVTTSEPGCCYNPDSYKGNDRCAAATDKDRCEDMGCTFLVTDDYTDCEMTTTTTTSTTTTEEPGCCYGDSAKSNDMCGQRVGRADCERGNQCEFRPGVDADCEIYSTTQTATPGCCKGMTSKNADMCADKDFDQCSRSTKCEFIENGKPEDCLFTTTTEAPGCCFGDGYKSNARCLKASDQSRCELNGCNWKVTDDPSECIITTTTTTTTTEEPGCCKGDSPKANPMCNARSDSKTKCEKSSSCSFVVGGDIDVDCVVESTTTVPGCCYLNPDVAYNKKYQDTCTSFSTERDCLKLTDSNGVPRCVFEELIDGYDCSLLWPTTTTTTEEPGCCKGSSYKNQAKCLGFDNRDDCERRGCEFVSGGEPEDCVITTTDSPTTTEEVGCCMGDSSKTIAMCNARESRTQCDRSSSCHWIEGGVLEQDCVVYSTTTEPGCCYLRADVAYSKRYQTACTNFYTERDCLKLTDSNGVSVCEFEPLGEYMDCEMLWPTTTTTTEAPGCCRGFSYKAQDKCMQLFDQTGCERKGCDWLFTDEPDDCIITTTTTTTTTTTEEPGCCKGDSARTNERCNKMETHDKCDRSSSCHWVEDGDVNVDCVVESTTTEPGCCYGNPDAAYSKRWMDSCTEFYTERDCLLLTNSDGEARCAWEPLGEGYDCSQLWPTTTTTTEEPGCCRGYSYKAQAKCVGLEDQIACERKDCEWLVTDDEKDCELTTTTTTTTTTTEEPGCCKAVNAKHQDMCDMKDTQSKCDRSSSCIWLFTEDPSACIPEETTTELPGCCYINPDAAYSKRWQESCTAFSTKRDCLLLTNGDGVPRCVFEELGDGYDCSQLWPTTTTTTVEPGCCYGDTAASNEMCAAFDEDPDKCDTRSQCVFRSGDNADCTFTPTTTTEEVGCCKGLTRKSADMCFEKVGREQCERSGKCEFIETNSYEDCEYDTTTSEPWLNAKAEAKHAAHGKKRAKGAANAQEAMLFGGAAGESAVAQAMQYEVSLSTLLLLVVAAFALHQAYKCVANRNGGYKEIDAGRAPTTTYQTV